MREVTSSTGTVQFLKSHGEKVALAVSVLIAATYLTFGVVLAQKDPLIDQVRKKVGLITDEIVRDHPIVHPGPPIPWLALAVGEYQKQPPIAAASNVSTSYYTRVNLTKRKIPKGPPVALPPITLERERVEPRRIIIKWKTGEVPKESKRAKISGFVLERRAAGKEWKDLGTLKPGASSYEDPDVIPKSVYAYRIRALTDDEKLKNAEPEWSQLSLKTPEQFRYTIKGVSPTVVTMQVEKFEVGIGWVKATFTVRSGRDIGNDRRIRLDAKRALKVDFSSTARVVSIGSLSLKQNRIVCHKKFDSKGNWICLRKNETRKVTVDEVIYIDDRGERIRTLFHVPKFEDVRCERHPKK